MKIPLIFDIKRASTNDGPGLRTVLFLKGCNLNCFWCHNPEGKLPAAQRAVFAESCIRCGACHNICPTPQGCTACGSCAEVCPTHAKRIYGKSYTVDEILAIISADKAFFDATGGGVTFSGGECMLYPDFLQEVAKRCKKNGISVAVDTAGNVPFSSFEAILPYVDLFLYDIKALDPQLHRQGTGVENQLILSNLERLLTAGKQIQIRVPVIPGFNEGEEVARIGAYCAARGFVPEYLPYHAMGEGKKEALEQDCSSKAEDLPKRH